MSASSGINIIMDLFHGEGNRCKKTRKIPKIPPHDKISFFSFCWRLWVKKVKNDMRGFAKKSCQNLREAREKLQQFYWRKTAKLDFSADTPAFMKATKIFWSFSQSCHWFGKSLQDNWMDFVYYVWLNSFAQRMKRNYNLKPLLKSTRFFRNLSDISDTKFVIRNRGLNQHAKTFQITNRFFPKAII